MAYNKKNQKIQITNKNKNAPFLTDKKSFYQITRKKLIEESILGENKKMPIQVYTKHAHFYAFLHYTKKKEGRNLNVEHLMFNGAIFFYTI